MVARGVGACSRCEWTWGWSSTSDFNQWFQRQRPECGQVVWTDGFRACHSGEWAVGDCGDIMGTKAIGTGVSVKHTERGSRFVAGTSEG